MLVQSQGIFYTYQASIVVNQYLFNMNKIIFFSYFLLRSDGRGKKKVKSNLQSVANGTKKVTSPRATHEAIIMLCENDAQ